MLWRHPCKGSRGSIEIGMSIETLADPRMLRAIFYDMFANTLQMIVFQNGSSPWSRFAFILFKIIE